MRGVFYEVSSEYEPQHPEEPHREGEMERERKCRRHHKNPRDWTLILLLQLAKPQHNGPVTQSKQISEPSLNNGDSGTACIHM